MEEFLIVDFGFRFGEQNSRILLSGMKVGDDNQRRLFLEFAQSSIGLMEKVDMGASPDVMKRRNSQMLKAAKALLSELQKPHAEDVADIGVGSKLDDLRHLVGLVLRTTELRDEQLKKGGRPITKGFFILEHLARDFRRAFNKTPSASPSGHFFKVVSCINNLYPDIRLPVNAASIMKILDQQ